jgi:hypothetical protein
MYANTRPAFGAFLSPQCPHQYSIEQALGPIPRYAASAPAPRRR